MNSSALILMVSFSLALQIAASLQALRLIRLTGRYRAWLLVVAALMLMAVRRVLVLQELLVGQAVQASFWEELVAMATSVFMAGGIVLIGPVFTDLKRSEERLRTSEERHRLLLAASPDPIVVYDTEGKVTYVNNAFRETFGWSITELLGRQVPYVPSHAQRQLDEAITSVRGERKILVFDTRRLTKDGRELDIQLSASGFLDPRGRPAGNIVILRDVTLHNQAQSALRESEEKYRLVVDNANEAIFIAQDGKIKFPNPRALSLSGYEAEELGRLPLISLVHEQDRDFVPGLHERMLAGHAVVDDRHFRIINKEGRLVWVVISAVPIVWDGRPASLCFVRDVTAQKQMERQLMHAQKMEAIGRLAGGIAHDFNNLLLLIKGYGDLAISHGNADRYLRAQILKIREAGDRGTRIIKQLLTLSQHRDLDQGVINLNSLVDGLKDFFRPLIPENVILSATLANDLGPVMGNMGQMEQVIMNLVVNALDAMPEGGRLLIETYNKEIARDNLSQLMKLSPGTYSVIEVSDTGSGMDLETVGHIFEPFFTTKEPGKGTGLGLSVVYGIVKKLGGGLSVYSESGKGATFKIYLPHTNESTAPEAAPRQAPVRSGGSETVLLVEDNDDVRALIAEALRLSGYRVLEAGEGGRAMELAAEHPGPLDLIISDMVMPGLSGPQLIKRIRKMRTEFKVLFISGYTEASLSQSDFNLAEARFLQKPFSIDELQVKMREILG